jgi:hypothetical protein
MQALAEMPRLFPNWNGTEDAEYDCNGDAVLVPDAAPEPTATDYATQTLTQCLERIHEAKDQLAQIEGVNCVGWSASDSHILGLLGRT